MKALRTGVTTGACAAAAAKAAAILLLSGSEAGQVTIATPNGAALEFTITDAELADGWAMCAVRKDAGDDPDVTNGMKIFAAVSKAEAGIEVDGGEGVGRVTKPGLRIPVGKAAINPVPMDMIKAAIREVCGTFAYTGGIKALISVPGGTETAKKTMNGRLGIVGGLSILGTTGIVEPMSERALIETIKAEIDVRLASGRETLLITPGSYGRAFAQNTLGLDMNNAVKYANFLGETLDYICMRSVKAVTLIGHAGKLVKVAGGVMNTHSKIADCRMEIIAAHCALAGMAREAIRQIMSCATVEAAMQVMDKHGVSQSVWESIGKKIGFHLRERTRGRVNIETIVFTLERGVLIRSRTGADSDI